MPRHTRQKSESGIYHLIMRGNNRQTVFFDNEDNDRFLFTLFKYKGISCFKLHAYCLMNNHIHLLLKVGTEPLEKVMRRVCGSYVYWYNHKYERVGNLFQDRFKSEPIDNETYFLTALRYIHQNPVKAGLVAYPEQYRWSSYNGYIQKQADVLGLLDKEEVLKTFDDTQYKAILSFKEYHQQISDDSCLDLNKNESVSDKKAIDIILKVFSVNDLADIHSFNIKKRDEGLKKLKQEYHLSIRQIGRLIGINRGIVERA